MPFSTRTRIAIILFAQCPLCLLFFCAIERSVLIALVFYKKLRYVRKVTMQRTQQFSDFSILWKERKNPVKCSACAVARKIETDCFCRNLPISNNSVIRISRKLAKNSLETTWMIYGKTCWQREFIIIQDDLRRITKTSEGILCEFVEGKGWKQSNNWVFLLNKRDKNYLLSLVLASPVSIATAHTFAKESLRRSQFQLR